MTTIVKCLKNFVVSATALMVFCVPSIVHAQENGQPSQSVGVTDAPRIAVIGAVANPGTYLYNGNVMLKDVFVAVGGFTKDADRDSIVITRGMLIDPSKAQKISYNYDDVMKGKAADVLLLSGDVVEVQERRRKRNFLSQIGSGLKRLPGVLVDNSLGLVTSTPLVSKAIGGLGSLLGIGGDKSRPESGQMMGIAGPVTIGNGNATNLTPPPTPLESALIQAIAAESPEVRERILQRVIATLQAQSR